MIDIQRLREVAEAANRDEPDYAKKADAAIRYHQEIAPVTLLALLDMLEMAWAEGSHRLGGAQKRIERLEAALEGIAARSGSLSAVLAQQALKGDAP